MTKEQYLEIKQLLACGWFFDPPEPMVPHYKTITDIFNEKYRIPYGLTPLPRGLITEKYFALVAICLNYQTEKKNVS